MLQVELQALVLVNHGGATGAQILELAARIRADVLACAPGAVAATKTLIRTLPALPDEQKVRFAAENFTECLKGEEGMEGVASFLEKRKPNWSPEGES